MIIQGITGNLISYNRIKSLCDGTCILTLEYDNNISNVNLWDEIYAYENDVLVGTFYIKEISFSEATGITKITAQDASLKLMSYFISETYNIGNELSYSRDWVVKFLNEAKINNYSIPNNSTPLNNNSTLGMNTAYEEIVKLLQQNGWYIKFDANNKAIIDKIDKKVSDAPALDLSNITVEFSRNSNDNILRNKATVWGGYDPVNLEQIFTSYQKSTPFNYDSKDIRTIVLANSNIYSKSVASDLAKQLCDEFSVINDEKYVTIAGFITHDVGEHVCVTSPYFSGNALITNIEVNISSSGATTKITFDKKCPRIFAYFGLPPTVETHEYVYVGTNKYGVYRKRLDSAIWESFGLDGKEIIDLAIYNNFFGCVTADGEAYYRTISSGWSLVTTEFYNEDNEKIESQFVHAVACTADWGKTCLYFLYYSQDYGRSWVVTVAGSTISSKLVESEDYGFNVQGLDIDCNYRAIFITAKSEFSYHDSRFRGDYWDFSASLCRLDNLTDPTLMTWGATYATGAPKTIIGGNTAYYLERICRLYSFIDLYEYKLWKYDLVNRNSTLIHSKLVWIPNDWSYTGFGYNAYGMAVVPNSNTAIIIHPDSSSYPTPPANYTYDELVELYQNGSFPYYIPLNKLKKYTLNLATGNIDEGENLALPTNFDTPNYIYSCRFFFIGNNLYAYNIATGIWTISGTYLNISPGYTIYPNPTVITTSNRAYLVDKTVEHYHVSYMTAGGGYYVHPINLVYERMHLSQEQGKLLFCHYYEGRTVYIINPRSGDETFTAQVEPETTTVVPFSDYEKLYYLNSAGHIYTIPDEEYYTSIPMSVTYNGVEHTDIERMLKIGDYLIVHYKTADNTSFVYYFYEVINGEAVFITTKVEFYYGEIYLSGKVLFRPSSPGNLIPPLYRNSVLKSTDGIYKNVLYTPGDYKVDCSSPNHVGVYPFTAIVSGEPEVASFDIFSSFTGDIGTFSQIINYSGFYVYDARTYTASLISGESQKFIFGFANQSYTSSGCSEITQVNLADYSRLSPLVTSGVYTINALETSNYGHLYTPYTFYSHIQESGSKFYQRTKDTFTFEDNTGNLPSDCKIHTIRLDDLL